MSKCVYMDLNGNCKIVECVHKEITCEARKKRCEYETDDGHCTLNECMYGDFLFIDDSAFETGKYCFCDGITDQMREDREDREEQNK